MSVCCTEPECSWRERRVKVQLGADASVQAGDAVTLKENAVYSVLDTSGSAAVAADTGVDIDPVRARASHWTATFDPCIVYAHVGACSLQRGTCMCCALSFCAAGRLQPDSEDPSVERVRRLQRHLQRTRLRAGHGRVWGAQLRLGRGRQRR